MSIYVNPNDGSIKLYQGDSGTIVFNGIPTDKNWKVFFSIIDLKKNQILLKKMMESNKEEKVVFTLMADETDKLDVQKGKNYTSYNYGLKICDDIGTEDTLIPKVTVNENGNVVFRTAPVVQVYPKYVEGNSDERIK